MGFRSFAPGARRGHTPSFYDLTVPRENEPTKFSNALIIWVYFQNIFGGHWECPDDVFHHSRHCKQQSYMVASLDAGKHLAALTSMRDWRREIPRKGGLEWKGSCSA